MGLDGCEEIKKGGIQPLVADRTLRTIQVSLSLSLSLCLSACLSAHLSACRYTYRVLAALSLTHARLCVFVARCACVCV